MISKRLVFAAALVLFLLSGLSLASQNKSDEQLAAQFFKDGEYEKALVIYERLYKKSPNIFLYNSYLNCLLAAEEYQKAEKMLKKRIKDHPNNPKYKVDLGYVYKSSGNTEEAKKAFKKIVRSTEPSASHIKTTAAAFLFRSEHDFAIESYQRGRKLLNNPLLFSVEIAQIYERKGEYIKMMEEFANALEADPDGIEEIKFLLSEYIDDNPENKMSKALKYVLLSRVQKSPQKTYYSEMLLWLSIQQKDYPTALVQAKALNRRLNKSGRDIIELGKLCADEFDFETALKAFEYIISKGEHHAFYIYAKIEYLYTQYMQITKTGDYTTQDIIRLEKEYERTISELPAGPETYQMHINLAHIQGFYLNKRKEAKSRLEMLIEKTNIAKTDLAEAKIELANVLLMDEDVWEASLLYSQVEKDFKNHPIGHEAKFLNAKLSYYIGDFLWAKNQLDILKAATSKLIANDAMQLSFLIHDNMEGDSVLPGLSLYAKSDFYFFRGREDSALKTLDSILLLKEPHNLSDDVLFKKAEIYISKKKYAEADVLLEELLAGYSWEILGDDALFLRAKLNEDYLKNSEKALELYQEFITEYPSSIYILDVRKRYRQLRGDFIN